MKLSTAFLCTIAAGLLASCVALPAGPSSQAGSVPPRLITDSKGNAVWDNPAAFGPVPAELQAAGDAACAPLQSHATGYHPKAQDASGNTLQAGGYFCVHN